MPEGEYFDSRRFTGLSILLGVIAVVSLVLCLVGAFVNPHQFSYSWLFRVRVLLYALRGLFFWTIVHHATDADWSVVVRRQLENIAVLLGVLAVLFIPILLLRHHLYSWMDIPPGHEANLIPSARISIFIGSSFARSSSLVSGSLRHNCSAIFRAPGQRRKSAVHRFGCGGCRSSACAVCPLSHVWRSRLVMSLNYRWYSTMFGVYIFAGAAGSSMALLVLVITALRQAGYLKGIVTREHYYIMGKWMLAFCVSGPTSVLASTCSSGMQTSRRRPNFS